MPRIPLLLSAALCLALPAAAAEPLELRDGDRVVLIGSTLIEREQKYGYWETVLTLRHPDKNVTFRNLGWSGDTVWGEARVGFDTPKEGYRRLVEHTLALKPTVIVIGYGTNESFAGETGLPRFREGYKALLDALSPGKARFVLLTPMSMEGLGRPLPDATEPNRNLKLYAEAVRTMALERGHECLNVLELASRPPFGKPSVPLTDNGLHLTEYGYWRTAVAWFTDTSATPLLFDQDPQSKRITLPNLPFPMPPQASDPATDLLARHADVRWTRTDPGMWRSLKVDGRKVVELTNKSLRRRTGSQLLDTSRPLLSGPDLDQVERLRATIVEKNRQYFHRWRPQNETYLFGFRKHEQGQNAREIPLFDPLVEKLEAEIARLRKPVERTYEIVRDKGGW
jgi:hypothetical protein